MAIDLQKLTLRRLLDTQSNDLYSKLLNQYFTGINQTLFDKIKSFYKAQMRLPSTDEIIALRKDIGLQEYIENQVLDEENNNDTIADEFLVSQLQDFYIRDETIFFLDKFVDNLDDFEKVEIVDQFQNHMLKQHHQYLYLQCSFQNHLPLLFLFPQQSIYYEHNIY